jgi:hypothetical protein
MSERRKLMFKFELKTFFKTTLEKLEDNGWKIEKLEHGDAKWCEKKINGKCVSAIYSCDEKQLYVSIYDNFADLNFASAVCEELKKLEVK